MAVTIDPSNGLVVDIQLVALSAPTSLSVIGPSSAAVGTNYSASAAALGASPAVSYSLAPGAPAWLSVNSMSGAVSGAVPLGITSFSYAVTATNSQGSITSGAQTVVVTPGTTKLLITPSSASSVLVGTFVSYRATVTQVTGSGALSGTISFTDKGVAIPGCTKMALSANTATCGVSFLAPGSYVIEASYGGDPNFAVSSYSVTQVVATTPVKPAITSPASTTATVGQSVSFTVTTTGYPAATLSETGALPKGLTFTTNANGTATITGTPASGTGGTYTINLSATNVVGKVSQGLVLNVKSK